MLVKRAMTASLVKSWIALIALSLFSSGCKYPSRLLPAAVQPIRLAQEQTVTSGKRVMNVPAGVYDARFQGADGIYYNAPRSIEQTKPKPLPLVPAGPSVFLHGGVFIPKPDAKDQRHGIWLYTRRVIPLVGKLVETRPLQMIRLNERIAYE